MMLAHCFMVRIKMQEQDGTSTVKRAFNIFLNLEIRNNLLIVP